MHSRGSNRRHRYSADAASRYGALAITGTTYEIGFAEVGRAIGGLRGKTVLDFGSGAGRSAEFLVSLGAAYVVGVDRDWNMVKRARKSLRARTSFLVINGGLPCRAMGFDAAVATSVFVEMATEDDMLEAAVELRRVLRAGAKFILMSGNPAAVGHSFRTLSYSEPIARRSGARFVSTVETPLGTVCIQDTYWEVSDYTNALAEAGFTIDQVSFPLPDDPWNWTTAEAHTAPFVVVTSTRR